MNHNDIDTEIDPVLLRDAAHELGHAVVDLAGGLRVRGITLNTRTGAGSTDVGEWPQEDTELWSAWLVGCLAGFEAETLWCNRHGGRVHRGNSSQDFANFRRYRRHAPRLSEGKARSRARSILRQRWSRIEALAPELAQRGHVAPSAVGSRKGAWW